MTAKPRGTLDVGALERWLAARPPATLLAWADRLLIASVDRARPERAALLRRAPAVIAAIEARSEDALTGDVTSSLVLTALLGEAGLDVGPLRRRLAPVVAEMGRTLRSGDEPWRSVFLYWRRRAELGRRFVPGAAPRERLLGLYHRAHLVYYAAAYGAAPVACGRHERALRACEATLAVVRHDADAVAEVLLAEACLRPANDARRTRLLSALGRRQRPDGSLSPPLAPPDARHHTACVAALAASLVG